MSVAKVLKLAEHRDRRHYRLALTRTMLRTDRPRLALLGHLSEVAEITGSDRAAAVWIDEYGPGLVHPHLVLDLLSDRPRRFFATEPLQRAWDVGIPGTFDEVAGKAREGSATFSIALGSDGARGWFLVADSVARRVQLDSDRRDRLMFLAGECSAIVLHRDLDEGSSDKPGATFAGWPFLKDLEGHEGDAVRSEVVGRRFEVGRLICGLVDEDLCVADERRRELADRARSSLAADGAIGTEERTLLETVLDAYEEGDLPQIATAALEAGDAAERTGHGSGALELYRCGYETATALCDPEVSIEAARASGRVLRRGGLWEEADSWYGTALGIAERAERWEMIARIRLGLALIRKDRGDFPAAREGLQEALDAANRSQDADTRASVYHDLMVLEHQASDLPVAARHGWRAVNTYASDGGRGNCLVGFAWVLKELGDWEAAEDAYAIARRTSDELYYRIYAYDGFAHMAALRGDAEAFDSRAAECDALGWEEGPATAKAEVLHFRGVSHALLGRREEAGAWLKRAEEFAAEHVFEFALDRAREALQKLTDETPATRPEEATPAPPEVREGLRAMRHDVAVPVGA